MGTNCVDCAPFLVDIKIIKTHTSTSTFAESHVLSAVNYSYPSKYTSLSGMLLLSQISQIVSRDAFLYAKLYLIFVYNSSIFFRNDCALPKTIVGGGFRWTSPESCSHTTSTIPDAFFFLVLLRIYLDIFLILEMSVADERVEAESRRPNRNLRQ